MALYILYGVVSDIIISVCYALRLYIKILAIFFYQTTLRATINAYRYDCIVMRSIMLNTYLDRFYCCICCLMAFASSHDIRYTMIKPIFMQQIEFIHIGEVVRAELYRQGKTVSWLARQIGTNRMAIYRMFESPSIDTSQLMRLSIALNTNFFALYSDKYRQKQTEK